MNLKRLGNVHDSPKYFFSLENPISNLLLCQYDESSNAPLTQLLANHLPFHYLLKFYKRNYPPVVPFTVSRSSPTLVKPMQWQKSVCHSQAGHV
jgi:hypothetical protein